MEKLHVEVVQMNIKLIGYYMTKVRGIGGR
jgi:hypothetical protein